MLWRDRIAFGLFGLPTLGLLGQGMLYLTTSRFMPYHSSALAAEWGELPTNYRGFVLGVIKGMGAGSVSVSMAILLMLWFSFRRGDDWARWATPLLGILFTVLTAYAAFTIDRLTPADTPWLQTLCLTVVYCLGGLFALWPGPGRSVRSEDGSAAS